MARGRRRYRRRPAAANNGWLTLIYALILAVGLLLVLIGRKPMSTSLSRAFTEVAAEDAVSDADDSTDVFSRPGRLVAFAVNVAQMESERAAAAVEESE